jgi:predicted NAD/FAD-binding protein
MKIAIIGSGVSGLVAAYLLHRDHHITVYEAGDHVGGHANTVRVNGNGQTYGVDTGFVVFNEQAYPNFVKLLDRLEVASQPGEMSFSVQCEATELEYASRSLGTVFAQRGNLLRPSFYRMLMDIRRFFREAREVLEERYDPLTLGEYFRKNRYSRAFVNHHIIPMGSAIWSAPPGQFEEFPVKEFVRFFDHHGFLRIRDRSPWRTICNGSRQYVDALTKTFSDRVHVGTPVRRVRRFDDAVEVDTLRFGTERFDRVIMATHSDQALAVLQDPSDDEREILGAIPYQINETVLHSDASLMPTRRRAWASWNYFKPRSATGRTSITYCMNKLQALKAPEAMCVSLNRTDVIDPEKVIQRMTYHHPMFDSRSFDAQRKHDRINGVRRTHYCGAYWGYGFHEDGVRSALAACKPLGVGL